MQKVVGLVLSDIVLSADGESVSLRDETDSASSSQACDDGCDHVEIADVTDKDHQAGQSRAVMINRFTPKLPAGYLRVFRHSWTTAM